MEAVACSEVLLTMLTYLFGSHYLVAVVATTVITLEWFVITTRAVCHDKGRG